MKNNKKINFQLKKKWLEILLYCLKGFMNIKLE